MEKKGDILNQLALITDLIEKINMDHISSEIIFVLNKEEMSDVFDYISKKNGTTSIIGKNEIKSFSINIGGVKITFNKSNV